MDELQTEIKSMLYNEGISDIGFSYTEGIANLKYGISIVVQLSDSIIDEIDNAPTHSYFHHYRTVNAYIDHCLLKIGLILSKYGYKYIPIPASQSVNENGNMFKGRYSHKMAACNANLGIRGLNGLFLHYKYGARVRLGTIFTDYPLEMEDNENKINTNTCSGCLKCVKACPAKAIKGEICDDDGRYIDPLACSNHMKNAYKSIGRGAVCGICIAVCPYGEK